LILRDGEYIINVLQRAAGQGFRRVVAWRPVMPFLITVFPDHQGGVRFRMQEKDSPRDLRSGEFQSEINFSEKAVEEALPELSPKDRRSFLELIRRVVETWYPETFSPQA
jgi:hypothetical protein